MSQRRNIDSGPGFKAVYAGTTPRAAHDRPVALEPADLDAGLVQRSFEAASTERRALSEARPSEGSSVQVPVVVS